MPPVLLNHVEKPDTNVNIGFRYVVFRSFVNSIDDQARLVHEVLQCFSRSDSGAESIISRYANEAKSSLKIDLGISCGEDVTKKLPLASAVVRSAFKEASVYFPEHASVLRSMSQLSTPLTGLALLYGVHTSMPPHYDSPTQPGQREEWLTMITLGNTVSFRCNDQTIELYSGDVIVMDSMAVLHGVEDVIDDKNSLVYQDLRLPFPSRLGTLFWHGTSVSTSRSNFDQFPDEFPDGFVRIFD